MVIITNDEQAFIWWRSNREQGQILVSTNPPTIAYLTRHNTGCHHISGNPNNGDNWTINQAKICSEHGEEIENWVRRTFGATAQIHECHDCRG